MDVRVKFLGGAKSVTGSKYLLEIDEFKVLIDCGLFQGELELRQRNWDPFPVNPEDIDVVIITHAHIDHTGYLPRLYREGYSNPIYCTPASEDLMRVLLLDSAKLQEEEAQWARKKGYTKHKRPEPLYEVQDAEDALTLIQSIPYKQKYSINEKISIKYFDAGHILGSAMLEVTVHGESQTKKIVFSGDLGRYDNPILYDPTPMDEADILFVESTYGNRTNEPVDPKDLMAKVILETLDRKGCVVVPAFAIGRTQTMLYYLRKLFESKAIPDIPIFIDSPMAINVTSLYKKHFDYHKLDKGDLKRNGSLFDYKNFKYCRTAESSATINLIKKNAVIISASGMCSGGRILHHLYHRLPRSSDTILFVGYQAYGTRGRQILENAESVSIFGEQVAVNCNVRHINGLSAHADKQELLHWLSNFKKAPKRTFIVHGEQEAAEHFSATLKNELGWNSIVPSYLESFKLFTNI